MGASVYLSNLDDAHAIELIKQLSEKGSEVKDPTNWLIAASKKQNGQHRASSDASKRVGELNKKGVLTSPVMWRDVCGPLLLISDDEAGALVEELEQKADSVKPHELVAFSCRQGPQDTHQVGQGG